MTSDTTAPTAPPQACAPSPDPYLRRAVDILQGEGLDPMVTVQVFVRDSETLSPERVFGLNEAARFVQDHVDLAAQGGALHCLDEGAAYASGETAMLLTGRLTSLLPLETGILGIISAATTLGNGGQEPDPKDVARRAARIMELAGNRPVMFFGARHWHPERVAPLRQAAVDAGFKGCMGTMPHALVLAFGHRHGRDLGTVEALKAFDRHVEPDAPRAALVDTFGREIDDALACARTLGERLAAIRIDTAEESMGQGAAPFDGRRFITGPGVTVESVRAVRDALAGEGFSSVRIILSSGFGRPGKLEAFVQTERDFGKLFDILGVGGVFEAMHATADVVRIEGRDFAKAGRDIRPNPELKRIA